MFSIVGNPRRVTMPPFREDFVFCTQMPVQQVTRLYLDSSFFADFPAGCLMGRLSRFQTASHRLPVTGMVTAFKQQDFPVVIRSIIRWAMHDDQRGNRLFPGVR